MRMPSSAYRSNGGFLALGSEEVARADDVELSQHALRIDRRRRRRFQPYPLVVAQAEIGRGQQLLELLQRIVGLVRAGAPDALSEQLVDGSIGEPGRSLSAEAR